MATYRQYQNPYSIRERIENVEKQLAEADPNDEWGIIDLQLELEELKEKENFAWQDYEYEENYMRENYPEEYAEEGMDWYWESYDE